MRAKVAVAGAGVYGATIAISLAEAGHDVRLFDPLGILRAASAINQYRIHSGYHYPRSPETIRETLEARAEFLNTFAPAIVRNSRHYYAIPHEGSQTPPALFEKVMAEFHLSVRPCRPEWMDFGFIDKCYEVDEQIYDPDILRELLSSRIQALNIPFDQRAFTPDMRSEYDYVVWATYGLGPGRGLFQGREIPSRREDPHSTSARVAGDIAGRGGRPIHRLRSLRQLSPVALWFSQEYEPLDHHKSR